MSKRILYVVNESRWFITHRLPIARAAQQAGFEVHVATPAGPFVDTIREAGFAWHEVPLVRGSMRPLAEIRTFVAFLKLYRSLRPDLVHHVSAKPVLYGTIAARMAGVPAIVNAVTGLGHLFLSRDLRHTLVRAIVGSFNRFIFRHDRLRIIFQNSDDRDLFVARGWARAADAVLIPSGADTEAFHPSSARNGHVPVVILPARLLYTKGVGEFVRASQTLRHEGIDARFALVGDVDLQNPASVPQATLESWRESGTVELWGERHDMPEVYRQADVVCLPSYREGMPKVLIEAAASGLPIVTTDTPGCRDVVRHGENGFLVPVADSAALAARLRQLLEDEKLRVRLGTRGRERAVEEFSVTRCAASTLSIYRELLG
jgi:glycosyltransferase involved in cell wall biosynthesis